MVIFHCYVSSPEGNGDFHGDFHGDLINDQQTLIISGDFHGD